jgi:exonuclease III
VHELLRSTLKGFMYRQVSKIRMVISRKGIVRFDILLIAKYADSIRSFFNRHVEGDYYMRMHIPFTRRLTHANNVINGSSDTHNNNIEHGSPINATNITQIASWNINSILNKKTILVDFLKTYNIDILALQEHRRGALDWKVSVSGYNGAVSHMRSEVSGSRGVALLIRNGIPYNVRYVCDWFVIIKVVIQGTPVLVGSVYLPSGTCQKTPLSLLRNALMKERHHNDCVIIMGDFNNNHEKLLKKLIKYNVNLNVVNTDIPQETYHNNNNPVSRIDYVLVSERIVDLQIVMKSQVISCQSGSDHWPILTSLNMHTDTSQVANNTNSINARLKIDRSLLLKNAKQIVNDDKFKAIEDELIDLELTQVNNNTKLEEIVNNVIISARNICQDKALAQRNSRPLKMPRNIQKMFEKRRLMQKSLVGKIRMGVALPKDYAILNFFSSKCNTEVKKMRKAQWEKFVTRGAEAARTGDARAFFRWCRSLGAGKPSGVATPVPIRSVDGELVMDEHHKAQVWSAYFGDLLSDNSGLSKNKSYWSALLACVQVMQANPMLQQSFSWAECTEALKTLANNKACGINDIPAEFYKLARAGKDKPSTALGSVIFKILNSMFTSGYIPHCINVSEIITIPKKGDLSDMSNYRGISIADPLNKLFSTILNKRLQQHVESMNVLKREQVGFRTGEEAVAQAVALIEICSRRKAVGLSTFLVFLDLKKAFDLAPHEGVLEKWGKCGVAGTCMSALAALYSGSMSRVRVGNTLSDLVNVNRGVKQGDPISPLSYNIFINDMFDDIMSLATWVPGCIERVPGLLFADDACLIADNIYDCQLMLDKVAAWAKNNNCSFNYDKCNALIINSCDNEEDVECYFHMDGNPINIVSSVEYLGITINEKLDCTDLCMNRAKKCKNIVNMMTPFLTNKSIPLNLKVKVIKSIVIPSVTYGSEIFGMSEVACKPIQTQVDRACKLAALGKASSKTTSAAVVRCELGITPIYAIATTARVRLFRKIPSMRTWVKLLAAHPAPTTRGTWIAKSQKFIEKNNLSNVKQTNIKGVLSKTYEAKSMNLTSLAKYTENGLSKTNGYIRFIPSDSAVIKGISWLLQARTNALWTAFKAERAGLVVENGFFLGWCPFCLTPSPETLTHMLCHCPSWALQRNTMISNFLKAIRSCADVYLNCKLINPSYIRFRNPHFLLGSFPINDTVVGAVAPKLASLFQFGSTTGEVPPLFIHVASFLASIMPTRAARIWLNRKK